MKLAFVAPFGVRPKGTVGARMLPMAQALARRGHHVRVVVPPYDDPQAPRRLRREDATPGGAEGRVEIVILPCTGRPFERAAMTLGLVRQAMGSNGWRPDLAHVFKPVGYSGAAAFLLGALRVPRVIDMDDWEGPGGWVGVNPYPDIDKFLITLMESALPRMAGAVTAASRTLEARAWDFGLPRRRVAYVPNGVSRDKYGSWREMGAERAPALRGELGFDGVPTLLLYTRFDVFPVWWVLRILRLVLAEVPEARLLVVGQGFDDEMGKLLREAESEGLRERIVAPGFLPEEDIPAHLALGDVCIYPIVDNLINRAKSPVKVLEPMVMGLAIAAQRVGQAAEFLGDAGLTVEPGDIEGLAAVAVRLLRDEGLRHHLGAQAERRVWDRFNWDQLCVGAERAYSVALASEARAGVPEEQVL